MNPRKIPRIRHLTARHRRAGDGVARAQATEYIRRWLHDLHKVGYLFHVEDQVITARGVANLRWDNKPQPDAKTLQRLEEDRRTLLAMADEFGIDPFTLYPTVGPFA